MFKIGVGITAFRREFELKRLLNSIFAHKYKYKFDLAVSIDGYDEGLISILNTYENVSIICNNLNGGVAKNKNRLIKFFTDYDIVFLLEDDIVVLTGLFLERYVNALYLDDHQFLSYNRLAFFAKKHVLKKKARSLYYDQACVGGVPSVFTVFRKNVIEKIGYFDEGYGKYGREHVDYGRRLIESSLIENKSFVDVLNSDKLILYSGMNRSLTSEERNNARLQAIAYDNVKNNSNNCIELYCKSKEEPKLLRDCRNKQINNLLEEENEQNKEVRNGMLRFNNRLNCEKSIVWCNIFQYVFLRFICGFKQIYHSRENNLSEFIDSCYNKQDIYLMTNNLSLRICYQLSLRGFKNKKIYLTNWKKGVSSNFLQFLIQKISYIRFLSQQLCKIESMIFGRKFNYYRFFSNYYENYISSNVDLSEPSYIYNILGFYDGDTRIIYDDELNSMVIQL